MTSLFHPAWHHLNNYIQLARLRAFNSRNGHLTGIYSCLMISGKALKVEKLNLHLEENRAVHHTDEYEHQKLIVRRGQPFNVTVTFDRALKKNDKVVFQLVYGLYFILSDCIIAWLIA